MLLLCISISIFGTNLYNMIFKSHKGIQTILGRYSSGGVCGYLAIQALRMHLAGMQILSGG